MINEINFCINHSRRIKNQSINSPVPIKFKSGYNSIIGPNGYGKTTILEAISNCEFCKVDKDNSNKLRYISFEELNPKIRFNINTHHKMVMNIRSLFNSHGESVRDYLLNLDYCGESCLLIDAPETGQDLEEKIKINSFFQRFVNQGNQLIIATNDLFFIHDNIIELKDNYLDKMIELSEKELERFYNLNHASRKY